MNKYLQNLGLRFRDKVTGFEGVATSVCFDLYGCVQVVLTPPIGDDGKYAESHWYDVNRLEPIPGNRVMDVPSFGEEERGPAEKPARNR
jgi:hypothetical protein